VRRAVATAVCLMVLAAAGRAEPAADCGALWSQLKEVAQPFSAIRPVLTAASPRRTDGGLCEIDLTGVPLGDLTLGRVTYDAFVAEDAAESGQLRFVFEEFGLSDASLDGELVLQFDAVVRRTHVELALQEGDGSAVQVQLFGDLPPLVAGRPPLLGLVESTISQLSIDVQVTPDLLQRMQLDLSDLRRVVLRDLLVGVSTTSVSDRSRREFLRFAGATPDARGQLTLTVLLVQPVGLVTLGAQVGAAVRHAGDAALPDALGDLFAGKVVTLEWKPGRL